MTGDTSMAVRFWAKVQRDDADGCWEWLSKRDHGGYGRFNLSRSRSRAAHRVAYELTMGPIPDGLTIDHLCRNRGCVNPAHLEPVTQRENVRRGLAPALGRARNNNLDRCPAGHPYSGLNLFHRDRGWRGCRTCQRLAVRDRNPPTTNAALGPIRKVVARAGGTLQLECGHTVYRRWPAASARCTPCELQLATEAEPR